MPEPEESGCTPAGRRNSVKMIGNENVIASEHGFRENSLTAYGNLISDKDALNYLIGKSKVGGIKTFLTSAHMN